MKISDTLDPHILSPIKLKAFWALDKMENESNDRYTAANVALFLVEKQDINISRQAIQSALKSDKTATHRSTKGYKLMENGRKQLRDSNQKQEVVMIEAGKPFSAKNIILKDIFTKLKGEVLICDPYIDIHTLDVIFKNSDKKSFFKILTKNIIDKPSGTFTRHLIDLRSEGYKVETGVYSSSDLHDRYIMDDQTFWLSGNSLNHLGNKESFIVRLGEDIRQGMLATFNNRWKVATKI
ncbi:MAG: hypothetical protein UT90_C0014G0013 [Parcubacteria group bacterium GW2011_GWA1_40_21]|nr:MAG: hypothetical protein UT80_C0013G0011 [Parcubacteria group bacterium GW2011_GWC1_40_13]KKR53128.1 MAG: hypothetical protein UT90_C0014G0013 [Parcubacteria group bacterium GW2011_GWA1_40_21]